MVQQQVDNLWQHFVGVICLNQTGRIQVKRVLPEFFDKWPTPQKYLKSDKKTVIEVIKSLGFYNRRENTIRQMTKDFLTWDCLLYTSPSPRDVEEWRMTSSA